MEQMMKDLVNVKTYEMDGAGRVKKNKSVFMTKSYFSLK